MLTEVLIAAALLGAAPPGTGTSVSPASAAPMLPDAASEAVIASPIARTASAMISDDALKASRGGETHLTSSQTIAAIVNGNVITGNYTAGSVTLSENALSNFNGLGNVLINTGAQNSLQTGMSIVINVAP